MQHGPQARVLHRLPAACGAWGLPEGRGAAQSSGCNTVAERPRRGPQEPHPRAGAGGGATAWGCGTMHQLQLRASVSVRLLARLQKMHNPTGTACAAAPRSLKTLARAGSLRAASGRSLKTLGQNLSSWRERVPVAPHFLQPGPSAAGGRAAWIDGCFEGSTAPAGAHLRVLTRCAHAHFAL